MRFVTISILFFLFVSNIFPCTVGIYNIKTNAVYGKVIAETQELILNATIQIYKNKEGGEEIISETKSDENGRFEIQNFPPGKYMIRAKSEHFTYSYAFMKLKKSSNKSPDREIVFTLVSLDRCSGEVKIQKFPKTK